MKFAYCLRERRLTRMRSENYKCGVSEYINTKFFF